MALSYLLLDELAVGASARVAARAGSCPGVGARPICHRSRHVGVRLMTATAKRYAAE